MIFLKLILIDGDWEENHPGLVIPLIIITENDLVGIFDIVMNEEAFLCSLDNEPFILPNRFSIDICIFIIQFIILFIILFYNK